MNFQELVEKYCFNENYFELESQIKEMRLEEEIVQINNEKNDNIFYILLKSLENLQRFSSIILLENLEENLEFFFDVLYKYTVLEKKILCYAKENFINKKYISFLKRICKVFERFSEIFIDFCQKNKDLKDIYIQNAEIIEKYLLHYSKNIDKDCYCLEFFEKIEKNLTKITMNFKKKSEIPLKKDLIFDKKAAQEAILETITPEIYFIPFINDIFIEKKSKIKMASQLSVIKMVDSLKKNQKNKIIENESKLSFSTISITTSNNNNKSQIKQEEKPLLNLDSDLFDFTSNYNNKIKDFYETKKNIPHKKITRKPQPFPEKNWVKAPNEKEKFDRKNARFSTLQMRSSLVEGEKKLKKEIFDEKMDKNMFKIFSENKKKNLVKTKNIDIPRGSCTNFNGVVLTDFEKLVKKNSKANLSLENLIDEDNEQGSVDTETSDTESNEEDNPEIKIVVENPLEKRKDFLLWIFGQKHSNAKKSSLVSTSHIFQIPKHFLAKGYIKNVLKQLESGNFNALISLKAPRESVVCMVLQYVIKNSYCSYTYKPVVLRIREKWFKIKCYFKIYLIWRNFQQNKLKKLSFFDNSEKILQEILITNLLPDFDKSLFILDIPEGLVFNRKNCFNPNKKKKSKCPVSINF